MSVSVSFPALFRRNLFRLLALSSTMAVSSGMAAEPSPAAPWQGATFAGDRTALEKLAAAGAKALRVYGEKDAWVLDEARKLGLGVVMGLHVGLPRHGFRLDDPQAIAAQEARIREFVRRYRRHPALLAWGIGNEVEHEMPDPLPAWREIDRLGGVVKALDSAHPTLMSVADASLERLKPLAACCANIDLLGINLYAGAATGIGERIRAAGITKPLLITELGPLGQWQAGRKPWGAPVELTSREKAAYFRRTLAELRKEPQVRGVFPFLWGAKQEQTATWHGLLLADGSLTEMTDALAAAWGHPPARPAPSILGIGIAADEFAPGEIVSAGVDARGEALITGWLLRREASQLLGGGDAEPEPAAVGVEILAADAASVRFRAPETPGAYRLFITVRDASGKAATANLPFFVRRNGQR
ncbi:MAG: hypothetical protein LBL48_11670 [Azoarcus sp.]|jgi:hypothetical protein|nr:hypothetical protein [Azoarcus sp.]